jgi:hypothetical protein
MDFLRTLFAMAAPRRRATFAAWEHGAGRADAVVFLLGRGRGEPDDQPVLRGTPREWRDY